MINDTLISTMPGGSPMPVRFIDRPRDEVSIETLAQKLANADAAIDAAIQAAEANDSDLAKILTTKLCPDPRAAVAGAPSVQQARAACGAAFRKFRSFLFALDAFHPITGATLAARLTNELHNIGLNEEERTSRQDALEFVEHAMRGHMEGHRQAAVAKAEMTRRNELMPRLRDYLLASLDEAERHLRQAVSLSIALRRFHGLSAENVASIPAKATELRDEIVEQLRIWDEQQHVPNHMSSSWTGGILFTEEEHQPDPEFLPKFADPTRPSFTPFRVEHPE